MHVNAKWGALTSAGLQIAHGNEVICNFQLWETDMEACLAAISAHGGAPVFHFLSAVTAL